MNGTPEYLNRVALPALGLFLHFSQRFAGLFRFSILVFVLLVSRLLNRLQNRMEHIPDPGSAVNLGTASN